MFLGHKMFFFFLICAIFSAVIFFPADAQENIRKASQIVTLASASDFAYQSYDGSPEQKMFNSPPKACPEEIPHLCAPGNYPPHNTQVTGRSEGDSLIIGPGREGDLGSIVNFLAGTKSGSHFIIDVPLDARKLIWKMSITPRTRMLKGFYYNPQGTRSFKLALVAEWPPQS